MAACQAMSVGNWSSAVIWDCGHVPTNADIAFVVGGGTIITLDQNVTVQQIYTDETATLNAGNYTITLSDNVDPLSCLGIFNAGTSTVVLSDTDHTFNHSVGANNISNNWTFNNLVIATPTAIRTITINNEITINGMFMDGTAAFPLRFVGTGSVTISNQANCPQHKTADSTLTFHGCAAAPPPLPAPVVAPINSGLALVLTFLGITAVVAWQQRKWKGARLMQ